MSFAQTSYSQKLGNGPYTLAEAGCFVTAFSNLLDRFGEGVDPPTLNQHFINHGTYSHDPSEAAGLNDDLSWGSVSAYDGQISTTAIGGAGWPNTNDAIVKFIYTSARTGHVVTHFCLVADHSSHAIIDSWDGITKVSPYGNPVAWASYERHSVQAVTPPHPAEVPAFTVESIGEVTKELKLDTHIWDLNQRSWPAMVNNPVGTGSKGSTFKTVAIAHHLLGGAYYLPEGSTTQGYNIVDTEDLPAPAPAPTSEPTPVPVTVKLPADPLQGVVFTALVPEMKKMYVIKQGGAEKWCFKDVKAWGDFKSVQHFGYGDAVFISGSALHPLGARYEVTSNDWNGFDQNGQPNGWYGFNKVDLSETRPSDVPYPTPPPVVNPTPAPAPVAPVTPAPAPIVPIDLDNWKDTYRLDTPQKYVATRELNVVDLSGQKKNEKLPAYDFTTIFKPHDGSPEKGVVKVYGTLFKDGVQYYRLRTNNDPNFSYWYGVPVIDPKTHKANLVPYPTPSLESKIVTETVSSIEKLFSGILPLWFNKNKK